MSEAAAAGMRRLGRTAYREVGRGPAIVFVHGVGLSSTVWSPQIEAVRGAHRAIAYDTLGHGLSDLPPEGADLDIYLGQLEALLDGLGVERPLLVGHSMGALIATAFAVTRPGRVAGLLALNGVYRRSPAEKAAVLSRADALDRQGPAATTDAAIARWFGPGPDLSADARARQLRAWLMAADPVGYARAYRVFATSDRFCEGRLADLDAPAVFATGALDPNSTPAMSRAMAAAAPGARAAILADERHMMPFVSPGRVNPVLEELTDRIAAAGPR